MPKTIYYADAILAHTLNGVVFTPPVNRYMALFLNIPTANGVIAPIEPIVGGYSRQIITFDPPSLGTSSSNISILWTPSGANWGEITAYGYFDSLTGGHLVYFKQLLPTRTLNDGDSVQFPVGSLKIHEV